MKTLCTHSYFRTCTCSKSSICCIWKQHSNECYNMQVGGATMSSLLTACVHSHKWQPLEFKLTARQIIRQTRVCRLTVTPSKYTWVTSPCPLSKQESLSSRKCWLCNKHCIQSVEILKCGLKAQVYWFAEFPENLAHAQLRLGPYPFQVKRWVRGSGVLRVLIMCSAFPPPLL